jgi:hypothetical protein
MESEPNDHEVFIDADEGWSNEKDSYEVIILRQISKCVEVLSREMTGGQVMHKTTKTGATEKYIEDVRELVVNHVDTLRMLLCTYIQAGNKKQIDAINKEINEKKEAVGNSRRIIQGRGEVLLKNIKGLSATDPVWVEFINFKALKYRELFEILVNCYNEQKAAIRSLEEE